jgi:two-component system, NarL family, response regulator LiaR
MESEVKRVILIDDNARVREGLSLFFETLDDWVVLAEGSNGQEAIELCERLQPDIVIMDLLMPVMDGVTATRHIAEHYPHIKVLVLTSATMETDVEAALEAGAKAVLRKYNSVDEIEATLRKVADMDSTHDQS